MMAVRGIKHAIRLNSGHVMPVLGLGTFQLLPGKVEEMVDEALSLGYNHIDTAYSYQNEAAIGQVIKDRCGAGHLRRKDVFLTSKIPPVFLGKCDVKPCAEEILENLKTPFVDMLLIHHPYGVKNYGNGRLKPVNAKGEVELEHHDLLETWTAMEDLVRSGHTNSIGLSNFSPSQIQKIWKNAVIKPANLQLECHAYLQQKELRKLCRSLRIVTSAYGPLGAPDRPADRRQEGEPMLLNDPIVHSIAKSRKRTPGQILLKYLVQLGMVVLPKTTKPERLKENMDIFCWSLDGYDLEKLAALDRDYKYFRFPWAARHPEYSMTEPF